MDDKYVWLAGWYATRLHAVEVIELERLKKLDKIDFKSKCGAWVSEEPRSEWAEKTCRWYPSLQALRAKNQK